MPTNAPTCPACGAKFAHSKAMSACSRCGLPDDILQLGPTAVARWKKDREKQAALDAGTSKSERKLAKWSGHKKTLRRKKHGRPV